MKPQQDASRGNNEKTTPGNTFDFKMLRNASKRSAVPPGSGTIHRASRTTYRPHGNTQEPLRCQPTPVRAIVKQPPLPLDLFRSPANPCKTLQSASICFILLCRDLTHFATKCSELFHFVSFTPVHLLMASAWQELLRRSSNFWSGCGHRSGLIEADRMSARPNGIRSIRSQPL